MKLNRRKLKRLIESEVEEQVGEEDEEDYDDEETVERVRVKNNESGNSYKVRQDFAFSNPQRYSSIRKMVREEVRSMIGEQNGSQAAEKTIEIRSDMQQMNRKFRDLMDMVRDVDPDMLDWTEEIHEDFRDLMDELYDLGNELSMR